MNKSLKTILLTTVLMTIPSCSYVGYKSTTFRTVFPEEKINAKQRLKNYFEKCDSLFTIEPGNSPYLKESELKLKLNFMKF